MAWVSLNLRSISAAIYSLERFKPIKYWHTPKYAGLMMTFEDHATRIIKLGATILTLVSLATPIASMMSIFGDMFGATLRALIAFGSLHIPNDWVQFASSINCSILIVRIGNPPAFALVRRGFPHRGNS